MLKFSKFCSERFHHNNDRRCRVNVVQFVGEIVRCLVDKKKCCLPLKLSLLRRSRQKSVRVSPNNVLRLLQISSKSVHFRRSYSRTREHLIAP